MPSVDLSSPPSTLPLTTFNTSDVHLPQGLEEYTIEDVAYRPRCPVDIIEESQPIEVPSTALLSPFLCHPFHRQECQLPDRWQRYLREVARR